MSGVKLTGKNDITKNQTAHTKNYIGKDVEELSDDVLKLLNAVPDDADGLSETIKNVGNALDKINDLKDKYEKSHPSTADSEPPLNSSTVEQSYRPQAGGIFHDSTDIKTTNNKTGKTTTKTVPGKPQ